MALKSWLPGCCCQTRSGNWACGLFDDDFDRADSTSVGNGWGETGNYQIINQKLEGFSGDIFAPMNGGPNISIGVVLHFTDSTQEARIYYGGADYYVGLRSTNTGPPQRNLYLVYGGVIRDQANIPFGIPINQFASVTVCITESQVNAYCGGQSVGYSPPTSVSVPGQVGLGVAGNTGNGPVIFEWFYVDRVSATCYNCNPVACVECSGLSTWTVDLSAWNGNMVWEGLFDDGTGSGECDACTSGWGVFVLDPQYPFSGQCSWNYHEVFCPGLFADFPTLCGRLYLTIGMSTSWPAPPPGDRDAPPCGVSLNVSISEQIEGAGEEDFCLGSQGMTYEGGANSASTHGPGVAVLHKRPGEFKSGNFEQTPCVADVITTGPGTATYTYYTPPDTVTITRL